MSPLTDPRPTHLRRRLTKFTKETVVALLIADNKEDDVAIMHLRVGKGPIRPFYHMSSKLFNKNYLQVR